MTSNRFVASTLILATLLCGAVALLNWRINIYGLFGDVHGRHLAVIYNQRQTKYLFSFNYIPANFDALLVGSSVVSNIDTAQVHGVHMYNASLSAGNITEEKLIAENALRRGHFRLLVICLNPYLVLTHGRKAGGMSPRDFWGALGSTDLISYYVGVFRVQRGLTQERVTPEGVDIFKYPPRDAGPTQNAVGVPQFALDATAVDELAELARIARAQGTTVVWVYPPVYMPTYNARRTAYRNFEERMRRIAEPGELTINFNEGSFTALTAQPGNFADGVHLTNAAALEVSHILDQRLNPLTTNAIPPSPQVH